MKRLMLFLFVGMFLISFVSALEIDNRGTYNENTKTMTITNVFGFGREIAELTLITPVDNIVPIGYQKVAEFKVTSFEDYPNALREMDFYSKNNRDFKKVEKVFDYKVLNTINVSVNDYSESCRYRSNGTVEACTSQLIGSHLEEREVWGDLNSKDLLIGDITVGIFTEVYERDIVEWIPTFYGVEIEEWATWTQSLNVDLVVYLKLDEASGTLVDNLSNINFTAVGSPTFGAPGIINTAISMTDNFQGFQNTTASDTSVIDFGATGDYSFNGWINVTGLQGGNPIFFDSNNRTAGASWLIIGGNFNNFVSWRTTNGGAGVTLDIDGELPVLEYHMITGVRNNSGQDFYLFIDGVLNQTALGQSTQDANADIVVIGSAAHVQTQNFSLDEFGIWGRDLSGVEITQLFNSGIGISYNNDTAPIVTQNSPIDFFNTTNTTIEFNCTSVVGDNGFLENLTLILDGVNNETVIPPPLSLNFTNVFSKTLSFADHNWSCSSSDDFNLSGSSTTRTFNVSKIVETNQTFNNETLEGSTQNFEIDFISSQNVLAVLFFYNGTPNVGNINSGDFPNVTGSITFVTPLVDVDTNVSFLWQVTLEDLTSINSTSNNQTIINIDADNCSVFTNQILNITMVDEEFQTPLSDTTIEIAIDLLSLDRTEIPISLNGTFVDQNPLGICLSQNITGGVEYSADAIIRYIADGYVNEYFNIFNLSITNETNIINLTLFDLNVSDATEFQLTFTGIDFLPVENAFVFLERQYIAENTFKTVELPKTDSNGQTVLHMVRNNVIYNIRVRQGSVTIGTFENIIAFCEDFTIGECTISLNALSNESPIFNYDSGVGIIYEGSPAFNATSNDVSFSFISSDATPQLVSLNVERRDVFGNISICNNSVVSSSGTLSCDIGQNLTDTSLFTTVSVNGVKWITSSVVIDSSAYGSVGYAFWFIFSIAMVLMLRENKNGIMISLLISYVGAVSMGLTVGGITGVGTAGIWMISISVVGIWQINRNRLT